MYFSKTVYLIFTIIIVRILLSNARNMQCNAAHGAAKYQEYIEGLLKLKGKMLSHAMKMLLKKEDEEYENHGKGGGAEEEHFIDLGSHPIATPRTLHAEDFTMPPKENTTCSTTTEREIVTWAATTHSQYHNLKYGSRGSDREEEAATRKHASDTDEATTERCVTEMKSGHGGYERTEENREENNATRKHGLEGEEVGKHRHHHKDKHDEENGEEEQQTTRKQDSENEETVTERHDNKAKNQHTDEDHEEATTTRKSEPEIEDAEKGHNTTKGEHKSEDREEETKKKSDAEKEEEFTQRSHNKTVENNEEEMVTRKEESSTKIISCTCNRGGMETTKGGNGDKDSEARKHGEHETTIERPNSKSKPSTAKNEGDELVKQIALELFKSYVLHRNETTTENAEEEQTGGKTENKETEEECSEGSEEESECEEESDEGEENETCGPEEEEVSNPPSDKQESATSETRKQQNSSEVEQEKQRPNKKISAHGQTTETNTYKHHIHLLILKPLEDGYTTCGPDEEEITDQARPHTTCGPDEEEITEPAGQHTTCGPDEEEITDQTEPHTTCGPDEEEITDLAVKTADHETHTSKPINPYKEGGALQIFYTNATTPTPDVLTERPADINKTNDTSFTTPTSIEAYPTMCFPVTETPGNGTLEAITPVSYQNVPPSSYTQTATTTAYQAASNAVTQLPEGAPTQIVQTTVPSVTQPPAGDTQEATAQVQTISPPEVTTPLKLPNNVQEVTTQSLVGYATMCYPVTEAPSATTPKPPAQVNTQKLRRHLKHRWKAQREFHAPSMRAKLSRVVRELRERENKAVDKSKILTLVHYTGQPRYQRYYLRGLKDSESSEGRFKKYESNYYPDEQDEPKYEKCSKSLLYPDYKEVRDEDQSGIFEDAMKVKLPFCPTKPPPPQPMAQKCAGKNHNIQHFRHKPTKQPMPLMPLDQCKKCDDDKNASPYIVPIPQIDTGSDDVCKSPDDADDFSFDTDFGDKNKFGTDKGCNDFGIEQFTKKSQAQISLENFRRQEQADPVQQKLSFMGRLLGRKKNCGSTKEASNAKALPTATPAKEPTESRVESIFPLQKIFNKWFKSKPNCDPCHQKVKLKDILQHKDSIKRLKGDTTKTKRQKREQIRNIKHHRRSTEIRRQRHKADFGSKLRSRHTNKRSSNICKINARKAARNRFTEHRKRRRHAFRRRPRRTSFYEQSNSQMNWRRDDVPDLPQSWNENFESDAYNIF